MDHLVVTAASLADGAAWLESTLGVKPQPGGEHAPMATHNALLRLDDCLYLEVIAPNPAAPPPSRSRWFELDRVEAHPRPRLATWVVRTDDIRSAVSTCRYTFGSVEAMSRGRFSWLITIPRDGSLPGGGAVPMLIQWTVDDHPASSLEDVGCKLRQLEVFSSELSSISELLGCLAMRGDVKIHDLRAGESPYLIAQIETPKGNRELSGAF